MTDICTGWTECRATWNQGAEGVMTQIQAIQKALPFPLKGFACDHGSAFLNWRLLRYLQNHKQPIQFTRPPPYPSNDNAHVEQKNCSCVRQLFGDDRLGDPSMVKLMNDLYTHECSPFTNFFRPTLKLASKARKRSQWIRKHSKAVTPPQRLLDHPDTQETAKEKLAMQIKTLNPFDIQKQIQRKLSIIFKLLR